MKSYCESCEVISYQLLDALDDGKEIRVMAGRFGYVREFEDEKDGKLQEILRFCEWRKAVKVIGNVPNEKFFNNPP